LCTLVSFVVYAFCRTSLAVEFKPLMRKAIILYNPLSGPRQPGRVAKVEAVAAVLLGAGVSLELAATEPDGRAAEQARNAIQAGCDTVLAAGGDGTVHDVLQGMVGSDGTLGIIPMGTANALAHDLGLPLSPEKAARALLHSEPRRIAVGKVEYQDFQDHAASRYFTVTTGVGADAHVFYDLNPRVKSSLGISAYYAQAFRLWLTRKMECFTVRTGDAEPIQVSQVLAVRITNFGGVLRELAPGAGLHRNDLRLVLFHTTRRLDYLRYIVRGLLGMSWSGDSIELTNADNVTCLYSDFPQQKQNRIFVEADGELLGTLPVKISIVPDALTLLAPGPLMAYSRRRAIPSRAARPSFSPGQ
jgi:YegS/Rv2252/BmrU family lipid kinase